MSSQHASLFEGLPSPTRDALTVYIFGPGFGEAQVVALPDGKWVVVDSCEMTVGPGEHGRVNLPLELLRHFEAPRIDLLVVTHPDLDHIKGLPRLISGCDVKRLWRGPGFHTSQDILVELKKESPFPGLDEMLRARDAMLPLMLSPRGHEVCYGFEPWPSGPPYDVKIAPIAPSSAEKAHEMLQLGKLYKRVKAGAPRRADEARQLAGVANRLSLSVVVWWDQIGVLLGGDVLHDESNDARGWSGVINNLEEDGKLHLIQGLRLIKNAHHGSGGAFSEPAWAHHAKGAPVELAVITRFNRGSNPPPQRGGLAPLQRFSKRIALCSAPTEGWGQVLESGWALISHPVGPGRAACVAVTLTTAPPAKVSLSAQGALFEPVSSPAPSHP